jgi:hypothetical protein
MMELMERMILEEMMVFIHKTFFDQIFVYIKSHKIDKFVSGFIPNSHYLFLLMVICFANYLFFV